MQGAEGFEPSFLSPLQGWALLGFPPRPPQRKRLDAETPPAHCPPASGGDRAFWAVEDRQLPADRALSGHQSIMEPWAPGSKLVAGEEGHWPLAAPTQLRRWTKLDSPVIGTEG